jgi:hypothetical protein
VGPRARRKDEWTVRVQVPTLSNARQDSEIAAGGPDMPMGSPARKPWHEPVGSFGSLLPPGGDVNQSDHPQ